MSSASSSTDPAQTKGPQNPQELNQFVSHQSLFFFSFFSEPAAVAAFVVKWIPGKFDGFSLQKV